MADIFLSYARADATSAARVARELDKRGWSVWFDREIPAHETFADVIAKELEQARAVLVLWSAAAAESQWVRSEANRARELHKLVQASLGGVRLPMPFDQIHCADLGSSGRPREGWLQVAKSLELLLSDDGQPVARTDRSSDRTRRQLLIGAGAAAVIGGGGYAAWRILQQPRMSPEAQLALQKGLDALQSNDAFDTSSAASAAQAIAFLTDATRLAPDSAQAWGGLAMAYAVRKRASPPDERPGLESRSRSAAQRALAIDGRELRAIGALRMLEPVYRNWQAAEAGHREALRKQPHVPLVLFLVADVLASVGRCEEAAEFCRQFDRNKWLIAGADRKVIIGLWSAGDLSGADNAMRLAVERWPQHPLIWRTRLAYLTFSGRLGEAQRVLRDLSERPSDVDPKFENAVQQTIDALAGRSAADKAVQANLGYLQSNASALFGVAHALSALGALSELTTLLNGYFFGEGAWAKIAPIGGDEDRQTIFLFQPPMHVLWSESRFNALLGRIGLEGYWRKSGTVPDYRRS